MKIFSLTIAAVFLLAQSLPAETADATPLPPVATVLQRAAKQSEKESDNDRAFDQRYGYKRTRVTEYRNSSGDLKKRESKTGENNPAVQLVAYEPPPTDSKPESKEVPGQSGAVTDTHSNVRGKAFEKKEFLLNNDLLGRFQFTVAGREPINGRPALVLDFKPASKNLPERNFKDKFINKAAGRVWVDEVDYALVKADLHLTEKVNVIGGLVGAVWKFNYAFDRARTADGLWFTRGVNWHLEGREVFVRRTIDYHEERTGVQKVR